MSASWFCIFAVLPIMQPPAPPPSLNKMNKAIPTPNNTLVTGPENELAAVSRNGVLESVN